MSSRGHWEKESPEEHAENVARVMAECEAMRAAGVEMHGCDFGVESDMSVREARAIAEAREAEMRVRFPGPWVGDVVSRVGRADNAYEAVRRSRNS